MAENQSARSKKSNRKSKDKKMTVKEAGKKGGRRVSELITEGEEKEKIELDEEY